MISVKKLVEYYEELFPISEQQKVFYEELTKDYNKPVKFLRFGCGTGTFESYLSKLGHDVTGVDIYNDFLNSANLRKRNQLMAIRFFQMNYSDASKYLGKGFYNVISILNSRLFDFQTRDEILNFLKSCRILLAPGGKIIVEHVNFDAFEGISFIQFPVRESVRAKLYSEITNSRNEQEFTMKLENGSGKISTIVDNYPIYKMRPGELVEIAREAGYKKTELFAGFSKSPFLGKEAKFTAIIQ